MVRRPNMNIVHLLQKAVLFLCILLFATSAISAPQNNLNQDSNPKPLNPLLYSSFKKYVPVNPLFEEYIKRAKGELMYWPNYPLTAAQIEARNKEWDRKYN